MSSRSGDGRLPCKLLYHSLLFRRDVREGKCPRRGANVLCPMDRSSTITTTGHWPEVEVVHHSPQPSSLRDAVMLSASLRGRPFSEWGLGGWRGGRFHESSTHLCPYSKCRRPFPDLTNRRMQVPSMRLRHGFSTNAPRESYCVPKNVHLLFFQ